MVDVNKKAPSVELTDAMQAGFKDAMVRVAALGLSSGKTLVDCISDQDWNSWDASQEIALVADKNGLDDDGVDIDDEVDLHAA